MADADGHADGDEPENKRRQLNSVSPIDNGTIDSTILQFQNQKLVQQLDTQKNQVHVLEENLKKLSDKERSYNETLVSVNRTWNQLVDDLALLGLRAGAYETCLDALDHADSLRGSAMSCPPEEIFLCRLLQRVYIKSTEVDKTARYVQEALASRCLFTKDLMKSLNKTIEVHRAKTERLSHVLYGKLSSEDAMIHVYKMNDALSEEASHLRRAIDSLHAKHIMYKEELQRYLDCLSRDHSEIKRLSVEVEEKMVELEESRRKLVNLRMEKEGSSALQVPVMANGSSMSDKSSDKNMDLRELKDSLEEAKALAAARLSELQEAREGNLILLEKVQALQNELENDKYVLSSKPYTLLSDHLQRLNSELERYKGLTETMQVERNNAARKEEELSLKVESTDAFKNTVSETEASIEDLEAQLKKCISEKNELEVKMEEAEQDLGRKDIKEEFRVMASALSKEMGMMETQLNRYKEIAQEAVSLRDEADALRDELFRKIGECTNICDRCAEQMVEIKSLKDLREDLEKEKQELQIFLDMYGQQCFESRDVMEIKDSERRAQAQAEILKCALDEHSLELRVKAAYEAEAACQLRLIAAETEIADLWSKLDDCERKVMELREAIKIKDGEAETYIAEIETIGQAYEDMQTQNQHLLQQVTERDDYNIKLVSESVKAKQAQSSLLSEKQALCKQLQQINSSLDLLKVKIARVEDQAKTLFSQAKKTAAENRQLFMTMEATKQELMDAEKELKWLRSAVDSSDKEYEQNQQSILELQKELESDRTETKKLEEEVAELNRQVDELNPEGRDALIQKLQDEIKECKAILKCGVCFDRPKEVVITKCYHLFCNLCIQRNLEIRHRKCPGCGTPFGQNDVKQVNI